MVEGEALDFEGSCKNEIFLSKLISNASDALDKIHTTNKGKLDAGFIRLVPDKAEKTLSIIDNGIGMTKADLVNNLGVSIYSDYLVADKVMVTTKHDNHDQYIWEFQDGASSFTVIKDLNGEQIPRGTKVTLFLSHDQFEYLEEARIKDIVKKHSEFITHPIYLWTEKIQNREMGDDVRKKEGCVDEDKDKDSKKKKNIKVVSHEWELVNIWLHKPGDQEERSSLCSPDLLLPAWLLSQVEMEKKYVGALEGKVENHIPNELAYTILSKLPLKSLKKFGCVSKSWALLFENPLFLNIFRNNFISNHHSYYEDTSHLLCVYDVKTGGNPSLYSLSGQRFQNKVKLDWPNPFQEDEPLSHTVGSTIINGIICLGHKKFVLWNPATREIKMIPPSPVESVPSYMDPLICFHGFGYDCVRDDYKIIRYVCFFVNDDMEFFEYNDANSYDDVWEIYSLRSNSWRKLEVDRSFPHLRDDAQLYLDGMCHWLSYRDPHTRKQYLVSFNLNNEEFLTTLTPLDIPSHMYDNFSFDLMETTVVTLNGYIALISNYIDRTTFHISILAELGVKESWIKLFTIGPWPYSAVPIGVGKIGNIFFSTEDGEIVCYDLGTHMIEELGIRGNISSEIKIYKESLLPIE